MLPRLSHSGARPRKIIFNLSEAPKLDERVAFKGWTEREEPSGEVRVGRRGAGGGRLTEQRKRAPRARHGQEASGEVAEEPVCHTPPRRGANSVCSAHSRLQILFAISSSLN